MNNCRIPVPKLSVTQAGTSLSIAAKRKVGSRLIVYTKVAISLREMSRRHWKRRISGEHFGRAKTFKDRMVGTQQRDSVIGSSRRSEMATFQGFVRTPQLRLELCINNRTCPSNSVPKLGRDPACLTQPQSIIRHGWTRMDTDFHGWRRMSEDSIRPYQCNS